MPRDPDVIAREDTAREERREKLLAHMAQLQKDLTASQAVGTKAVAESDKYVKQQAESLEKSAKASKELAKQSGIFHKLSSTAMSGFAKATGLANEQITSLIGSATLVGGVMYGLKKSAENAAQGLSQYIDTARSFDDVSRLMNKKTIVTITTMKELHETQLLASRDVGLQLGMEYDRMKQVTEVINKEIRPSLKSGSKEDVAFFRDLTKEFLYDAAKFERLGVAQAEDIIEQWKNYAEEFGVGLDSFAHTIRMYKRQTDEVLANWTDEFKEQGSTLVKQIMDVTKAQDGYYRTIQNTAKAQRSALELQKKYNLSQKEAKGIMEGLSGFYTNMDEGFKLRHAMTIAAAVQAKSGGSEREATAVHMQMLAGGQEGTDTTIKLIRQLPATKNLDEAVAQLSKGIQEFSEKGMSRTLEALAKESGMDIKELVTIKDATILKQAREATIHAANINKGGVGAWVGAEPYMRSVGTTPEAIMMGLENFTKWASENKGKASPLEMGAKFKGMNAFGAMPKEIAETLYSRMAHGDDITKVMEEGFASLKKDEDSKKQLKKTTDYLSKIAGATRGIDQYLDAIKGTIEASPLLTGITLGALGLFTGYILKKLAEDVGDQVALAQGNDPSKGREKSKGFFGRAAESLAAGAETGLIDKNKGFSFGNVIGSLGAITVGARKLTALEAQANLEGKNLNDMSATGSAWALAAPDLAYGRAIATRPGATPEEEFGGFASTLGAGEMSGTEALTSLTAMKATEEGLFAPLTGRGSAAALRAAGGVSYAARAYRAKGLVATGLNAALAVGSATDLFRTALQEAAGYITNADITRLTAKTNGEVTPKIEWELKKLGVKRMLKAYKTQGKDILGEITAKFGGNLPEALDLLLNRTPEETFDKALEVKDFMLRRVRPADTEPGIGVPKEQRIATTSTPGWKKAPAFSSEGFYESAQNTGDVDYSKAINPLLFSDSTLDYWGKYIYKNRESPTIPTTTAQVPSVTEGAPPATGGGGGGGSSTFGSMTSGVIAQLKTVFMPASNSIMISPKNQIVLEMQGLNDWSKAALDTSTSQTPRTNQ